MRVYSHFAVDSLANSYIVGERECGDAIVIDPAVFEETMLEFVEENGYFVRTILLTHCDETHLAGLVSILRIYEGASIYARVESVLGIPASEVVDGSTISTCGTNVEVIALPGHGRDSVAYRLGGFLFTGCALSAGETGAVPNPYAKANLLDDIQQRIFSLPDQTVVFPFYGPPTTVGVERSSLPMQSPPELRTPTDLATPP